MGVKEVRKQARGKRPWKTDMGRKTRSEGIREKNIPFTRSLHPPSGPEGKGDGEDGGAGRTGEEKRWR